MQVITFQQIQHVGRLISQLVNTPKVAIIGGYHGINAGDLALGESIKQEISKRGFSSGLQTIYNIDQWKWPLTEYAIIGGGAVGYNDSMEKVYNRFKNCLSNVALLGVDFNEEKLSDKCIDLLISAKWVSCRSKEQAVRLSNLIKRENILYHPDIAFSLKFNQVACCDRDIGRKIMLVNVLPIYGKVINGKIVPNIQYSNERPNLYSEWPKIFDRYCRYIRILVENAVKDGYEVQSMPFAKMDEDAAKIILNGLPVIHNNFVSNPLVIARKMASAKIILATRFHATIFGLKLGLKVIPFAYAKKNETLFDSIGVESKLYYKSEDLLTNEPTPTQLTPIYFDSTNVIQMERDANNAINTCLNALGVK